MRLLQVRLRTVIIIIAFWALIMTVFVQTISLRQAEIKLEWYQAEAALSRAEATRWSAGAEGYSEQARIAVDQLRKQAR